MSTSIGSFGRDLIVHCYGYFPLGPQMSSAIASTVLPTTKRNCGSPTGLVHPLKWRSCAPSQKNQPRKTLPWRSTPPHRSSRAVPECEKVWSHAPPRKADRPYDPVAHPDLNSVLAALAVIDQEDVTNGHWPYAGRTGSRRIGEFYRALNYVLRTGCRNSRNPAYTLARTLSCLVVVRTV